MSGNTRPSWYSDCTFPVRNGVFYQGDTAPTVTLGASGATAYEVRDWYGNVVSTGAVSGTSCTPTAPPGGWRCGWYRIYFTGPKYDSVCGYSYAATMFSVIRDDARFQALPSGTITYYGNESADPVGKAALGLGMSRHIIGSYATNADLATCVSQATRTRDWWLQPAAQYLDPARPRYAWCSTPGAVADSRALTGSPSGTFLRVYAKDETVNPANVYLATAAGTSSGTKVQVFFPDSSTLVETYDNLAGGSAAATAINAASAYVKAFDGGASAAAVTSATAIGATYRTNIASVVSALYPLGVTHYEFTNEPALNAESAHQMRLFAGAVHAANPAAKAMGPCSLSLSGWGNFIAAGGLDWCDEISFHDYNSMTNGNLELGRFQIERFLAALSAAGQSAKTLWQTEAGAAFTGVYGVHHPRRARVKILHTLLWEQYGVPKERNVYWYDRGHGFWAFPAVWQNEGGSLNPDAAIHRTLAEEVWGRPHATRLQFGAIGDRIALGSVYSGTSGSTVVLILGSAMPGATVTLTITGASGPLTTVDAWGNTSSVQVSGGRVTVPVGDLPTYVRLPVGATATVYRLNDWPPVGESQSWQSFAGSAIPNGSATDGAGIRVYGGTGGGIVYGAPALPDTMRLTWQSGARVDRVIVWNAMSWQLGGSLVDFDVQTSNDGVTWTTRATVTRPTPESFMFGTGPADVWCTRETFWDEQWIFDVPLPQPVVCKHLRLYVRAASYGGEPDAAAVAAGGQGASAPVVGYQEIAVMCDSNVAPQFVVV